MSDKLTDKQKLFCEAYLSNGFNATDAYIDAGYKAVTFARQEGYRLTTIPYIREYLDESIDALIGDKKGLSERLIKECKRYAFMSPETMEIEQVRASDKKQYVDMLFKYLGSYDNKSEIELSTIDSDGQKVGINYDKLSTEALKEIVKAAES
ncbi:MAG: terminase small subunit [Colwellia sp.]|nr:terminase small subunit [Colwellia sp.]